MPAACIPSKYVTRFHYYYYFLNEQYAINREDVNKNDEEDDKFSTLIVQLSVLVSRFSILNFIRFEKFHPKIVKPFIHNNVTSVLFQTTIRQRENPILYIASVP